MCKKIRRILNNENSIIPHIEKNFRPSRTTLRIIWHKFTRLSLFCIIPHVGIFLKPINPSKYNERFSNMYTKSLCSWHDFLPHWTFVYCPQKNESISGFLAAGRRSNASQRNDVSHSVWNWLKKNHFITLYKCFVPKINWKIRRIHRCDLAYF